MAATFQTNTEKEGNSESSLAHCLEFKHKEASVSGACRGQLIQFMGQGLYPKVPQCLFIQTFPRSYLTHWVRSAAKISFWVCPACLLALGCCSVPTFCVAPLPQSSSPLSLSMVGSL